MNAIPFRKETPESQVAVEQSKTILNQSLQLEVSDDEGLEQASSLLKIIKGLKTSLKEQFDELIKIAHEKHKRLLGEKRKSETPLNKAEETLKQKVLAYTEEKERQVRVFQMKIEKEQRKQEEETRLLQAEKLESEGRLEEAEAMLEQPMDFHMPVLYTKTKVEGLCSRENWDFEILDPNLIPREYMVPDLKKIRGIVKALKSETKIPGVRTFVKKSTFVRS